MTDRILFYHTLGHRSVWLQAMLQYRCCPARRQMLVSWCLPSLGSGQRTLQTSAAIQTAGICSTCSHKLFSTILLLHKSALQAAWICLTNQSKGHTIYNTLSTLTLLPH